MKLSKEVIHFLEKQEALIVSTLGEQGQIHGSVKGLVGFSEEGKLLLIDLYLHNTFHNLKRDPRISVMSVNIKEFKGFVLQGKARIVPREELGDEVIEEWENRIIARVSKRVIAGVQQGVKSKKHFEADLPKHPKYLIEVLVDNVIDLRPPDVKN